VRGCAKTRKTIISACYYSQVVVQMQRGPLRELVSLDDGVAYTTLADGLAVQADDLPA